jgi:hypothetical protein
LNIQKMRIVRAVALAAFYARGTAGTGLPEKVLAIVVPTTANGANDAISAD